MTKRLVLIATIAMMANGAFASKARMTALSSTPAITDVQSIFSNPADVNYVGEFATFEMGETATTPATVVNAIPNAEGGFLQSMGDAKWGFYLGKQSLAINDSRYRATEATGVTFLTQKNPFDVYYGSKAGDMSWGLDFNFSNSDERSTTSKQGSMALGLGVKTDVWGAYANIGLGSTSQVGDAKYNGTQGLAFAGHYYVDAIKLYAKQEMFAANATDASAAKLYEFATSITTLGMTNKWKQDANSIFYGLALKMTTADNKKAYTHTSPVTAAVDTTGAAAKVDAMELPVHIGMEVDAASWLTLRGSITQNVFLGTKKITPNGGTGVTDTISENTTTAAGAGFKFGKNNLDFVMVAGVSGAVAFDNLGAQASYTYMF